MISLKSIFSAGNSKVNASRFMFPIVTGSVVSSDLDTMQVFLGSVCLHDSTLHLFYTGNAIPNDIDQIFKATKTNDGNTQNGWNKLLDAGEAKVILAPSGSGFDKDEVFCRTVFFDVDEWKMYYTGRNSASTPTNTVGLATSTDGITFGSRQQVHSDTISNSGFLVYKNGASDYRALALRQVPSQSVFSVDYLTSTDGITWVEQIRGTMVGDIIKPSQLTKQGSTFFVLGDGEHTDAHPPINNKAFIYKTTDFTSYELVENVWEREQPGERSAGGAQIISDGSQLLMFQNYNKFHNKAPQNGGEAFTSIKVWETNTDDPTKIGASPSISYPSFVKKYWPLYHADEGTTFTEKINSETVTHLSNSWNTLRFLDLTSDSIIWRNLGLSSTSDLALKMRIVIDLTITKTIFNIGTDIVVELVLGKLRVSLNNNTKQYISTANIAIPLNIGDPAGIDEVWVGFIFRSSTLTLCNGNDVDYTATKTIDGAMSDITDSKSNVVIGNSEVRSVTLNEGITDQEWIDLDL